MALEINPTKSKWWYGRIQVNGRKIKRNLGVEIQGKIPPRLSQVGDIVFEKSRARAQAALERFQLDAKKRCKAEELIQTIHEIRTGERISYRAEHGDPGVSFGTYASVLRVLGLHGDLDAVARDDVLGRKLQDLDLPVRRRAPKRKEPK